jgi:hypothetical protein
VALWARLSRCTAVLAAAALPYPSPPASPCREGPSHPGPCGLPRHRHVAAATTTTTPHQHVYQQHQQHQRHSIEGRCPFPQTVIRWWADLDWHITCAAQECSTGDAASQCAGHTTRMDANVAQMHSVIDQRHSRMAGLVAAAVLRGTVYLYTPLQGPRQAVKVQPSRLYKCNPAGLTMKATKPQFLPRARCSSSRGHMIFTLPMGPKRPNSRARCASFTCTHTHTPMHVESNTGSRC